MDDIITESTLRRRRRSTSEALLDNAKSVEQRVEKALHWAWDELPDWRRDNAFIVSGYRPTSNSYLVSLASVFSVHNESVNIWTHLLGAVAFTVGGSFLYTTITPRYETASAGDVVMFGLFLAGAFLCLGMSATYHTVCNHSPEVAKWGNKLDYTGIVFLIVGSYMPALYYGLFCLPKLMEMYLSGICLLGFGCLTVSWFERFRTPEWRPYRALMFVMLGISSVIPVLHALTMYGYENLNKRMGLDWVLIMGVLYITGAGLYASRWPERNYPKTFDIWGSSHQIFHVLVVLAATSHFYGMLKAFDYHHTVMGARC